MLTRLALRDEPVALIAADQRMPQMTGIELLEQARTHAAGREVPAAHGVRRHRRGHQGDQRHRPRLLPAQAVGPSRGAALPGHRRPARRLAAGQPGPHRRRAGGRAPVVGPQPRHQDCSWPATTSPTAGTTSSATPRPSGCATWPQAAAADLPLVLVPDGDTLRAPSTLDLAGALGLRTSARAAAVRRVHRRRRPGRPGRRGVRGVRGPEHRHRRARGARRAGRPERGDRELPRLPQGAERLRPHPAGRRAGRPASAPRWCSPATSSASRAAVRCAPCCFDGSGEIEARALIVATGVSYRRLAAAGLDELTGRGRLLRRERQRGEPVPGRRRLRRRRRQLGRPGRAQPGPLRQAGRAGRPGRDARRARCRSTWSSGSRPRPTSRCATAARWWRAGATATWRRSPSPTGTPASPRRWPSSWLFVFIGASPRTDWLGPDVVRDDKGFVVTGHDLLAPTWHRSGGRSPRAPFALETSVPGVFAAGDVRLDSMKRVASAVGEGAMSIYLVHRYLATI